MDTGKIRCDPRTFGGSTKPEDSYSKFREKIRNNVKTERIENKEVSLKINLYINSKKAKRSDLDNYLKAIIDGLTDFKDKWTGEKKGVIAKENQIKAISIKRIIDDEEGVDIEIK